MITLVIPQHILNSLCDYLVENWATVDDLYLKFDKAFVNQFLTDFSDYLTEGEDEKNQIKNFTLGLNPDESLLLKGEILATNQKWLELKP